MGENKASYLAKSYVDKLPASDQEDVREVKKGVGNAVGGALQNPLGGLVSLNLFFEFLYEDFGDADADLFCCRLAILQMRSRSLSLVADMLASWSE